MGTFYFQRKISKMTFSFVLFFIHPNLKLHRNERVYLELVTSVKRDRERVFPLLISNTFMAATFEWFFASTMQIRCNLGWGSKGARVLSWLTYQGNKNKTQHFLNPVRPDYPNLVNNKFHFFIKFFLEIQS